MTTMRSDSESKELSPSRPFLPAQCSLQMSLHIIENFSAKHARLLQSFCVHSVEVSVQTSLGSCLVVTLGTQELLGYFMNPFDVKLAGKIGAIVFSTIVTRDPCMLSLRVLIQGCFGWLAYSTDFANKTRMVFNFMLFVLSLTAERVANNINVML